MLPRTVITDPAPRLEMPPPRANEVTSVSTTALVRPARSRTTGPATAALSWNAGGAAARGRGVGAMGHGRIGGGVARGLALGGLAAGGTAAVVLLLLLPDLWGLLPGPIRRLPVEAGAAGLVVAYAGLVRAARRRVGAQRLLGRVDRAAAWAFPGKLAVAVGLVAAALVLAWAPHYLTWPWCRDADTFAVLALSWDRGILPYRDIRGYNFPGHIYLHWILGRLAGWGRTAPFYALDAAAVAGLGAALAAWSRRRLGAALPGLVAYLAFLTFYLGLEYELVAQRDWHATLLAVLALLAAEFWPGRRGRAAAAAAMAAALTIRPHAALFLPALASAVAEGAPPAGGRRAAVRAIAEAALMLAGAVLLAFAPVLAAGLADDLARGLRVASYGGPYSRVTLPAAVAIFADQLRNGWTLAVLIACGLLAALGPPVLRRPARTWLLAMAAALAYRPLHPVQHDYLAHPREVVGAVAAAVPLAALVGSGRLPRAVGLLAVAVVIHAALPAVPRFCMPGESLRALGPLARGAEPELAPLGAWRFFRRDAPPGRDPWSDYRATLAYLRRATSPSTQVANVLTRVPFPALNGPTGRLSPFRAESGICWMWLVDEDRDARFAAELARAGDAVVVWRRDNAGAEPRLRLPRLTATIQALYQPEARFGSIEVWRRRPDRPPRPLRPDEHRDAATTGAPRRLPTRGGRAVLSRDAGLPGPS